MGSDKVSMLLVTSFCNQHFSLRYRPISARSAIVSAAPDPARNSLSVRLVPSALLAALRCCRSVLCLIQARASAYRHTSVSASPVGLWHNKMGVACGGKIDSQIQSKIMVLGAKISEILIFIKVLRGISTVFLGCLAARKRLLGPF